MYNNIDIKCSNYAKCNKIVKLVDLEKHEYDCTTPNCLNFECCGSKASKIPELSKKTLCSLECELQLNIKKAKNGKEIFELIKKFSETIVALRPAASNINMSNLN